MESPSAVQLPAEAQEDSSRVEALLLSSSTSTATECNGPEEPAPDAAGIAFLDDLSQLTATSKDTACEASRLLGDEGQRELLLLEQQDMGSYASRNSSEEDIRLEASAASANPPQEPQAPSGATAEPEAASPGPSASSSPRRRPSSAAGVTDFQPHGVEVSEEKAQQLKNEVKRLSPIHVSQRERTLGEISLTSDSLLRREASGQDTASSESVKSSESASAESEARLNASGEVKSRRELVIRLSRVDGSSSSRRSSCQSPPVGASGASSAAGDEEFAAMMMAECGMMDVEQQQQQQAKSSEEQQQQRLVSSPVCPFGANLVLERCNAPGYSENRVLSSCGRVTLLDPKYEETRNNSGSQMESSASIVEKLHIGDEIEFSSPVAAASAVHCRVSSPPPIFNVDVVEENELETGSDSSEVLASIAAAAAAAGVDMLSACEEDGLTQAIMTRLEQDRPEAFTEDSAESLALAAAARDEVRSDGSDSGLGSEMPGETCPSAPAHESDSETSFLDRIPDDILADKADKGANQLDGFAADVPKQPLPLNFGAPAKSSLKRRRLTEDCIEDATSSGEPDAKRLNVDEASSASGAKKKRNIQFDAVTVYYFPRAQGFTCVPSQGGSTLGMSATHTHAERFSLTEHAAEQRRLHRARLAQLRSERAAANLNAAEAASSSEDPSDDTDDEPSDSAEELDIDSYYFLQPVPTWQRRALLRAAGVRRIDAVEKDECRDIRASREHCGCGCKGYCDPESCPCSRANVKCQVDRAGFPCGCSRDGCANSSGRIEFNPVRVRTHFIHTLMRLELEKKPAHHHPQQQQQRDESEHQQESTSGASSHHQHHHAQANHHHLHQSRLAVPLSSVLDSANDCLTGGFTSLHYDSQDSARPDSLDLYTIRDDCYGSEDCLLDGGQRKMHSEFSQSFQHYGAQGPSVGFQQNPYADYQSYQSLPSTSRSPFQPQFQTNSGFSHYGSYSQDSSSNSNGCHQSHSLIQQQQQQHSNVIYDAPFAQDEVTGSQYTNLNSIQPMNSVVQQIGKLEPFSELLSARYSYYDEVVNQQQNHQQQQQHHGAYHANTGKMEIEKGELNVNAPQEQLTEEDCDENFGEIIKKSMVETVSA